MLTRKRIVLPNYSGDAQRDFEALKKAISDYWQSLEGKAALSIETETVKVQALQYPSTQVASSDVNTLDDYAEKSSNSATLTPQAGSFTSATASYQLTKIGNRVFGTVTVTITTNGTASGVIDVNIPYVPAEAVTVAALQLTGKVLKGYIQNNGGQGQCRFVSQYDGTTYAGGDGQTLIAALNFRV